MALKDKILKLETKYAKQLEKINLTRQKLEKARRKDIERADGSVSHTTPS